MEYVVARVPNEKLSVSISKLEVPLSQSICNTNEFTLHAVSVSIRSAADYTDCV